MIDDMNGQYASASEAYKAGLRAAAEIARQKTWAEVSPINEPVYQPRWRDGMEIAQAILDAVGDEKKDEIDPHLPGWWPQDSAA